MDAPISGLLGRVDALLPAMRARAAGLDRGGAFPAVDMAALSDALEAVLPVARGGQGVGTEPGGRGPALALLQALGGANLSVARLWEAHLNAVRLVVRYGTAAHVQAAAADVRAGSLWGLWVTDGAAPLRAKGDVLAGSKGPCSGAGHCRRAVVTVGSRLAVIGLDGTEPVRPIAGVQGMRAAAQGVVELDGVRVLAWLGSEGCYLREPDFSCGAWRGSAAAAGALAALVDEVAAALRLRGQAGAPMQQARFGAMLIARETARMWSARAAEAAEQPGDVAARVATVNLARIAVEAACLDGLRDAQRSLGLAAFVAPHPAERIGRDLQTYLRQPAPDAVLLEAAAWHLR